MFYFLVTCTPPDVPIGGAPYKKDVFVVDDEVQFECLEGYTLVGDATAVCQEDRYFSASTFVCLLGKIIFFNFSFFFIGNTFAVQCSPPEIANGIKFEKKFYNYNEEIFFKCQSGYELAGDISSICLSSGVFSEVKTGCVLSKLIISPCEEFCEQIFTKCQLFQIFWNNF